MAKRKDENEDQNLPAPIDATFEEVREPAPDMGSRSLAVRLTQTEIDAQYDRAVRNPRQLGRIRTDLMSLVRTDKDDAASMYYSLPRGNKTIEGPSVRFAELLYQIWGNCYVDSRIVEINRNDKYVLAEAVFVDRQTGAARKKTVRRPIRDKYGNVYNESTIDATCGAAMAIAERNAILASIPRIVWRSAYDDARKVAAGDLKDLVKTRRDMISAFGAMDIKPDLLFKQIGVSAESDITLQHVTILRGMYSAINNNESTKEEVFAAALEAAEPKTEEKAPAKKAARNLDDIKPKVDLNGKAKEDSKNAGYKAYHQGIEETEVPEKFAKFAKEWQHGWAVAQSEDATSEDASEEVTEE